MNKKRYHTNILILYKLGRITEERRDELLRELKKS